jgi:hypothetical protein
MMSSLVQIAAVVLVCIMAGRTLLALACVFALSVAHPGQGQVWLRRVLISVSEPVSRQAAWRTDVQGGLPPHLLARVTAVRQHMRYVEFSAAGCVIALFGLIIAGSRA